MMLKHPTGCLLTAAEVKDNRGVTLESRDRERAVKVHHKRRYNLGSYG